MQTKREMISNLYGSYGLVRRVWFDYSMIINDDFTKTEIKVDRELDQEEKKLLKHLSIVYNNNKDIDLEKESITWINANVK